MKDRIRIFCFFDKIGEFKEEGGFFKGFPSLVYYAMTHELIEYDALSDKHRDDIDEIMEMGYIKKNPIEPNFIYF